MAYPYDLKVVVSGKKVEVFKYKKYIWKAYKRKPKNTQKEPKQLDMFQQEKLKKEKRKFSTSRTKTKIRRLANSNPQLNKFFTLTFAENITDLKKANYIFNKFILRMNYKYSDFQYLAVHEFQKRGAVHYHLLCNLPFVKASKLQTIWNQGFIRINRIDNINNVGAYMSKYLGKELNERLFNKKKFFRSRNLKNPVEILGWQAELFIKRFLYSLTPEFEKIFKSDWTGEVEYKAFSLKYIIFINGFDRQLLKT